MKIGHSGPCCRFATVRRNISFSILKFKRWTPQLGFWYYVMHYGRPSAGRVACVRPEAVMALTFRPKLDKIVELLLHLAHVRPGADKYQAVKFFYLADREHLIRYGRPISFDIYYALSYGPVASNALDLLNKKARDLPFETSIKRLPSDSETVVIGKPKRAVNRELFSKSDLMIFDEVINKYGKLTFDQLYDLTHEHMAYKKAWDSRGYFNRAEMDYADMIDDPVKRQVLVEELAPISAHMQ
jgi:uncharacterized phage-associated protein